MQYMNTFSTHIDLYELTDVGGTVVSFFGNKRPGHFMFVLGKLFADCWIFCMCITKTTVGY
jgi:hypothetical protein